MCVCIKLYILCTVGLESRWERVNLKYHFCIVFFQVKKSSACDLSLVVQFSGLYDLSHSIENCLETCKILCVHRSLNGKVISKKFSSTFSFWVLHPGFV